MNFYIQASNPRALKPSFIEENLSAAIESVFPMNTENAILFWNHIAIPLSYKYDISYMVTYTSTSADRFWPLECTVAP